jgi:hypothetical protein
VIEYVHQVYFVLIMDINRKTHTRISVALPPLHLYCRLHPVLAVRLAGQVTSLKLTVGLSAFLNQSNLHLHPAWSFAGKFSHSERDEMPPYCWPQPLDGAPNCELQPLKMPTPPPGIAMSKWLSPRSPPVLVACTIIFWPETGPDVKVNLDIHY